MAVDFFPKTQDEIHERTFGGAIISVACAVCALTLVGSELARFRAVETIDRLDVDTSHASGAKLDLNVDVYFPSLACAEIVTDVTDADTTQQLHITDTLHKVRMDRGGTPIDIPQPVQWHETVAPAFQQRKVLGLMDDARAHLGETLAHLAHEKEENPTLSEEEHREHQRQLAEQAALLQGRLEQLVDVAAAGDAGEAPREALDSEIAVTKREMKQMHERVKASRFYSDEHRHLVFKNLHAMSRSLERLAGNESSTTASNLQEALRIRLSILRDHVHGFVSASDIDRRDKYDEIEELLGDMHNSSHALAAESREHVQSLVERMRALLLRLNSGVRGAERRETEEEFHRHLAEAQARPPPPAPPRQTPQRSRPAGSTPATHGHRTSQADLRGEEQLPDKYCGSCYGASLEADKCCNTCDDVKQARPRRNSWQRAHLPSCDGCDPPCSKYGRRTSRASGGCPTWGASSSARARAAGARTGRRRARGATSTAR